MNGPPSAAELLQESPERIEICRQLNELNVEVRKFGAGRTVNAQFSPEHFTTVSIGVLRTYLNATSRLLEELVYGL